MKKLICISLLALSFQASSQTEVIDRNVTEERMDSIDRKAKVSTYFHFGTNVTIDKNDSLSAKPNSGSIGYGLRFHLVNSKRYSLLTDVYYGFDNYKIDQNERNLITQGIEYNSQQIRTNNVRVSLVNRIHLSNRGTENGMFIDLGASASYVIGSKMILKNDLDPALPSSLGAEESEVILKKLNFIERFGYQVHAAFGRNGLSLFGQYRLSNLFKPIDQINAGRDLPEIAPLSIGLRLEL